MRTGGASGLLLSSMLLIRLKVPGDITWRACGGSVGSARRISPTTMVEGSGKVSVGRGAPRNPIHGRSHRWGWKRERIGRNDGKAVVISVKMPELQRYGVVKPNGLVNGLHHDTGAGGGQGGIGKGGSKEGCRLGRREGETGRE